MGFFYFQNMLQTYSWYVLNGIISTLSAWSLSSTHTILSMQAQTMQVSHPVGRSVMHWWSLMAQWGRFWKLWRRQVWSTILSSSSLVTTGRCLCTVSVSSFMSVSIYICVRSQARANAEVSWGKRRTDEMWQRNDLRRRNERASHRILAWIHPTRC